MGNMAPPSMDHTSKVITISTQIMIGSIMAIFLVVTICFFVYLYFKCCWSNNGEDRSIVSWRRQLARQQRRTNSARLSRQGLDPAVLKSLHKVVYDSKNFKEGLECSVCLSEVSQGETVRLLPKCNHGFHVDCIDMWFQSHSTCPLCRNPVFFTPTNDANNNSEVQVNDSFHSSMSNFLDDNQRVSNSTPRFEEVQVFPGASTSTSSYGVNRPRNQEMVIEIPISSHELCDCEDCLASSPLEEAKTPVMTRLGSLKRLWSFGKRVASPSPKASSSSNFDQQV